jgi:hypothetical protein
VETTLDQYANERALPRDYAEQFFLPSPPRPARRAKAAAPLRAAHVDHA